MRIEVDGGVETNERRRRRILNVIKYVFMCVVTHYMTLKTSFMEM